MTEIEDRLRDTNQLLVAQLADYRRREDRLREALKEIVKTGGQDLCRGIAAEALRDWASYTPS